jgi:hypothetical protein
MEFLKKSGMVVAGVFVVPALQISAGNKDDQLKMIQIVRFPTPVHGYSSNEDTKL